MGDFLPSSEVFARLFYSESWEDVNLAKRIILGAIDKIKTQTSEFYGKIQMDKAVSTTKPYWMEELDYPREVTGTLTGGDTLTVTGNLFGAAASRTNLLKVCRTNAVLRHDSGTATTIATVDAIHATNPILTLSATSGTSMPSNSTGQVWTVINEPATDAEDAHTPRFLNRKFRWTTSELFTDFFTIEDARKYTSMEGVANELSHQLEALLVRMERTIASAVIQSWPEVDGSGDPKSTMEEERSRLCGLDWWPEYYFASGQEFENSEILVDLAGENLTQGYIDNMVAAMDANGTNFNEGTWVYVTRPEIFDFMQSYGLSYRQMEQGSTTAGFSVDKVRTKRGVDVSLAKDWYVPRNTGYLVNYANVKIHPFKGGELKKGQIASKNITSEMWQIARRLVGTVIRKGPISIGKHKNINM